MQLSIKKIMPYLLSFLLGVLFVVFFEFILPSHTQTFQFGPQDGEGKSFSLWGSRKDIIGIIFQREPEVHVGICLGKSKNSEKELTISNNYAMITYYNEKGERTYTVIYEEIQGSFFPKEKRTYKGPKKEDDVIIEDL